MDISQYNVTVGQNSTFVASITDPDSNITVLWLENTLPSSATFDNSTGIFIWSPQDTSEVNITLGNTWFINNFTNK